MSEILKRLLLHPFVLTQLIIVSFFVNILALASPIFVMQVLQRYIAYGVSSTLITLVTGVSIAIVFEFFFRNLRHRISRGLDKENHKIKQRVLYKIQSSSTKTSISVSIRTANHCMDSRVSVWCISNSLWKKNTFGKHRIKCPGRLRTI